MLSIRGALLPLDLPPILDGAAAFAREADLADVLAEPGSPDFDRAVMRILHIPGVKVLLADHDGEIVGGIGFIHAPYIWNPDRLVSDEIFWWTATGAPARAALALFSGMFAAGDIAGVTVWICSKLMNSPPAVDAVYRRRGLRPRQVSYVGVTSPGAIGEAPRGAAGAKQEDAA